MPRKRLSLIISQRLARTAGFEPAFTDPVTDKEVEAPLVYVRLFLYLRTPRNFRVRTIPPISTIRTHITSSAIKVNVIAHDLPVKVGQTTKGFTVLFRNLVAFEAYVTLGASLMRKLHKAESPVRDFQDHCHGGTCPKAVQRVAAKPATTSL